LIDFSLAIQDLAERDMRVRQFRRNGYGFFRGRKRIRDFVLPEIDVRETGVAYAGIGARRDDRFVRARCFVVLVGVQELERFLRGRWLDCGLS